MLFNIAYHIILVTVGPIQCMKKSKSSAHIMLLHKHVKLAYLCYHRLHHSPIDLGSLGCSETINYVSLITTQKVVC
jgi:hypothetical protein